MNRRRLFSAIGLALMTAGIIPSATRADDRDDIGPATYGTWDTMSEHAGKHPGVCRGEDWG